MFFQPPDQQPQIPQSSKTLQNNPRHKRKKKSSIRKKQRVKRDLQKRKHCRINITMSTWAESFTTAATWQLKHQVAYWKSKAVALEYENRILHDIIKKNCTKSDYTQTVESSESSIKSDTESDGEDENEDFEVSEEFIEFLRTNAKYKEDAKREREKLKAKMAEEENPMEFEETQDTVSSSENLKELYGKDWQRIAALEMAMKCNFINECDKKKPMFWPNIPFNFS